MNPLILIIIRIRLTFIKLTIIIININNMASTDIKTSSKAVISDYSTFIQELQHTADKLMNEVFELSSTSPMPSPVRTPVNKKTRQPSFQFNKIQYFQKAPISTTRTDNPENYRTFQNFIKRTQYHEKEKVKNIEKLHRSLEESRQREHTFQPEILKTSKKLIIKPIKDRCLQIQHSKQKKLFEQRAQKKIRQQNELNKIPFQPKINTKAKTKTFKEYYDEKIRWEKKKLEERQKRKQLIDVKKHTECAFKPSLQTQLSPFYKKNEKLNQKTKVQDRLLQRLQISAQKRLRM